MRPHSIAPIALGAIKGSISSPQQFVGGSGIGGESGDTKRQGHRLQQMALVLHFRTPDGDSHFLRPLRSDSADESGRMNTNSSPP